MEELLKAKKDANKAIIIQKQLTDLLAKGGFYLTKWISNCREVIDTIPEN